MAKLDLCATFLLRGQPNHPDDDLYLELSVSDQTGNPVNLHFFPLGSGAAQPVNVFIALSEEFVCNAVVLTIVDIVEVDRGFYCLTLVNNAVGGMRLGHIGISTLAIAVDQAPDNGRTLACACNPAIPARPKG